MRILILGGDGYLGWPTAMYLSNRGYEVLIVDDYSRKKIANDTNSQALIEGENMYERCEIFHHFYGKRIKFKEQDLKDFLKKNRLENFEPHLQACACLMLELRSK